MILIALFAVLAIVALVTSVATISLTGNAVVLYANTLTYPGIVATCIGTAWLFAKARRAKPRKFFDYLARGGFWYFMIVATLLSMIGLGQLAETYGWPTILGIIIAILAALKVLELVNLWK